jgi:stearoyl-CoA desaturase (delta-9 desaturase)
MGVASMLIINLSCFGLVGVAMWAVQMAWIPLCAAGVINGIGHYVGYRNFECKDGSRNITPFAFFLGGEELHNNHHAYATSAKFSAKPWEFDIGWMVIKMLSFVGLASPKRTLPTPKTLPNKTNVDMDTIRALITYRFQVMSRYTRDVVAPALREEKKRASKASAVLLRRAKTVLVRDVSMMEPSQKAGLATVLENFHSLRTVYQYRLKLQAIWSHSTASPKELLEALQEWCQQAEASGIDALLRFAKRLKTYVPQNV